jgi:acyl-CoA thioesterase
MTADASGGAVSFRLAPAGQRRKQLPWGFSNIDELVHFHEAAGTEWLQIEVRILTGSGGYASAQCQTWSDEGKLLVTAISQLAFFELQGGSTLASDSTT